MYTKSTPGVNQHDPGARMESVLECLVARECGKFPNHSNSAQFAMCLYQSIYLLQYVNPNMVMYTSSFNFLCTFKFNKPVSLTIATIDIMLSSVLHMVLYCSWPAPNPLQKLKLLAAGLHNS